MIYVASSWRNQYYQNVVHELQKLGHNVYDFKSPESSFNWKEINPKKCWSGDEYREAMKHPLAIKGYEADKKALDLSTVCILVLPAGRSASWEFGYAKASNKECFIIQFDSMEPELMYREATVIISVSELHKHFRNKIL